MRTAESRSSLNCSRTNPEIVTEREPLVALSGEELLIMAIARGRTGSHIERELDTRALLGRQSRRRQAVTDRPFLRLIRAA